MHLFFTLHARTKLRQAVFKVGGIVMKPVLYSLSAATIALLVSACASQPASQSSDASEDELMQTLLQGRSNADQSALESRIQQAGSYPLGTRQNPVRTDMPRGQHAYLRRLRCSDGNAPTYRRAGSGGAGAYGSIIDIYELNCEGGSPSEATVIMDMYHRGYVETEAVPGFTIVNP